MATALFVPAGVLAAAAVGTMYRLGTAGDGGRDDLARLGLLFTAVSLVLVITGAMVRDRARGDESEGDGP